MLHIKGWPIYIHHKMPRDNIINTKMIMIIIICMAIRTLSHFLSRFNPHMIGKGPISIIPEDLPPK
jgi:hypothetical protein